MKTKSIGFFLLCLFCVTFFSCSTTRYTRSSPSEKLGTYRLTVYWLAHERWFSGARTVPLFHKGHRVAKVSKRFARALRMQGSGFLRSGRLIQYRSRCASPRGMCLHVRLINRRRYPMGVGAGQVPLRPMRSLAVDTRRFAYGTSLYIPYLGRMLRKKGRFHDGCFVAHDRGGRIRGSRLDLFVGTRNLYKKTLKGRLPQKVQVYVNHSRCKIYIARR